MARQYLNITQAMEQLGAFARDFAGVTHAYYAGLRERGFAHEDAMRLTVSWQEAIIWTAGDDPNAEGGTHDCFGRE